jgi:hypothetical protein
MKTGRSAMANQAQKFFGKYKTLKANLRSKPEKRNRVHFTENAANDDDNGTKKFKPDPAARYKDELSFEKHIEFMMDYLG